MINKRAAFYSNISSLEDLEREKKYLKKLIKKQGNYVEKDWDEIYSFWSFIPKTGRFVKNTVSSLSSNFNIISFIFDLLWRKKKK